MSEVVLISPPQTELRQPRAYIPLGIGYLAACLEKNNIDVSIMNLADIDNLESVNYPTDAKWFGISCHSTTYEACRTLINILRKRTNAKTVIGGPHPSVLPHETFHDLKPDFLISGEAEILFYDLITRKRLNRLLSAGIIKNLNMIPFPARHLFDENDVVDTTGIHGQDVGIRATTVLTSRGCPYKCNYCCKGHEMYQRYRYRKALNVRKELKSLIKDYKIQHVRFIDDEFTINNERTLMLCKCMEDLNLTWVCITRADSVTLELLEHMKAAGCIEVHVGVETGSNRLLEKMNKRTTIDKLLKGIKLIKQVGIRVKIYLIYDYPEETDEDRQLTIDFLKKAKPDKYTLSKFTPLPGSLITKDMKSKNEYFYPDEDKKWLKYKRQIEEAIHG